MGSQQPLLVNSFGLKKGMVLQNEGKSYTNGALTRNQLKRSPARRVLKKFGAGSRTRLQSSTRRGRDGSIRRRVKTLKRLIPNGDISTGLDGLFRETADYILSLQSRVRLMQVMVQALAGGSDDHQE